MTFRMGEIEGTDAKSAPRQVEKTVCGGRAAEGGEQPLQRRQRHDARIIGIREIA